MRRILTGAAAAALMLAGSASPRAGEASLVLVVTVDTLRADRLSIYGYDRPTTPALDRLLGQGARFQTARTVEPLTNPSMTSMLTSVNPQVHGATRNGLRIRPGLVSLPKVLEREGWATAAFVANWTLKDEVTGLAEHFQVYEEVLTRKRYFGLFKGEATAEDVTDRAAEWLADAVHRADRPAPIFLWVHYVEPHSPYRFQEEVAAGIGVRGPDPGKKDRYDTEVAFVDREIGRLLEEAGRVVPARQTLAVFAADHGESLGEHGYWGHGRQVYEPMMRIPMGITWPGRIEPQVVADPAVITDLAPTVLELLGLEVPEEFTGSSWADTLAGGAPPAREVLCYQTHRGAVHGGHEADRKRSKGLMAVAITHGDRKEILRMRVNQRELFDLGTDPGELDSLVPLGSQPSDELLHCVGEILDGLEAADKLPANLLDDENVEMLRELGYLD